MENISSTLEAFNLDTSGFSRLSHSLTDLHVGELRAIVESVCNGVEIPVHENERVNSMTMRYALVDAFREGRENINGNDLSLAQEKALNTAKKNGALNKSTLGGVSTLDDPSEDSEKPRKKRNPNTYPTIKRMVEGNPEASKDEIVAKAMDQLVVTEGTAGQYYSKARRELGLSTGQRGRKASNLFPTMLELVREHHETSDRETIIEMAVEQGIKQGTAVAYYYKALKTIEDE